MIWISIVSLIFLGLLLIAINIDIKNISRNIKRFRKRKRTSRIYINNILGNKLEYIERLIQKSNIRIYMPYSVWSHLFICLIFLILGTIWMEQYMNIVVSIIFGFCLFTVPFLILRIVTDVVSYRVKRKSVDFLIILKNFYIAGKNQDIFESFKKAADYIGEPLKTYIKTMIYEYEHKINPVKCLENFKKNLEVLELKIFVENLIICYIHGGDIVELIDAFIEEISKQSDEDDEESAEDTILNMGLYMLLLINFVVMYFLINSSYRQSILEPLWGQIVFVLDIVISIYIIIQSMIKLHDERR